MVPDIHPPRQCAERWSGHRCTATMGHDGPHACQPCRHPTAPRHAAPGKAAGTPGYTGRHRAAVEPQGRVQRASRVS